VSICVANDWGTSGYGLTTHNACRRGMDQTRKSRPTLAFADTPARSDRHRPGGKGWDALSTVALTGCGYGLSPRQVRLAREGARRAGRYESR